MLGLFGMHLSTPRAEKAILTQGGRGAPPWPLSCFELSLCIWFSSPFVNYHGYSEFRQPE